jgi:hypothetical protein
MATPTKRVIAEGVLYELCGGVPSPSFPIKLPDIYDALENKLNSVFKIRHIDTTLPSGETMPEAAMIATYENVAVTSLGNGKAKALLPIVPISMPKNMGIYLVYDPKYPDNPFIPLLRGQLALLRVDELLNDLMGTIGYEPGNLAITFTKDITQFGVSAVTMDLCVFEISNYSETDSLPIPADYIDGIQGDLIKEFREVLPKTGIVNNFTNATQTPTK